jgi:hypothetical protein
VTGLELLLGICYKEASGEMLEAYIKELESAGKMVPVLRAAFAPLLPRQKGAVGGKGCMEWGVRESGSLRPTNPNQYLYVRCEM